MHDAAARPRPVSSAVRAGVLLGAVGLFVLNLVFGPIAIGIGISALRRGTRTGWERAAAVASVILGAADVTVMAVLVAMSLAHGTLTWHFG